MFRQTAAVARQQGVVAIQVEDMQAVSVSKDSGYDERAMGIQGVWLAAVGLYASDWLVGVEGLAKGLVPGRYAIETVVDVLGDCRQLRYLTERAGGDIEGARVVREAYLAWAAATLLTRMRFADKATRLGMLRALVVHAALVGTNVSRPQNVDNLLLGRNGVVHARRVLVEAMSSGAWGRCMSGELDALETVH